MAGFGRLYKDGRLAVIHGCGYDQPSFSHFTSMAYWHTAAPNSGNDYGWVGRLADALRPDVPPNYLVNIDEAQSLAVRSRRHAPLVFDVYDRWSGRSVAGCSYHVAHPGGRNFERFPVNSYEAESRRLSRFFAIGHSSGQGSPPRDILRREFPHTLDLRWS